jgi:hypothetical protein
MKSIIKSTMLVCLISGLSACSKLGEKPYSTISTGQFYQSASDAQAALTAAYGAMSTMYGGSSNLMSGDFSADQVYPRAVVGRNTYVLFNYDPAYSIQKSSSRVSESPISTWSGCYSGIERANIVIAKVPAINMDATAKTTILGEAYFLRAFYYWTLTKTFGDVVLKTKPTETQQDAFNPKSPRADIYKQIYADLDKAVAGMPGYSLAIVRGHASKEVALGLYAKAALYNGDWATALSKAQAVINSGKYSLMQDFRDVFSVATKDAARAENMFAFESESSTPGITQQMTSLYSPVNGSPAYSTTGYGSGFVYYNFYKSFDPKDKRRLLLDTAYVNNSGLLVNQANITPITKTAVLLKKYADPNNVGPNSAANIPILRLADIYLIAAEAEARLNGASQLAYNYVNIVRARAGIPNLAANLNAAQFIDAVLQERSWELFGEGDRWFDLTRTNTFMTVIPKAVNDVYPVRTPAPKNQYFPIPQDEIDANPKLTQNDPWK